MKIIGFVFIMLLGSALTLQAQESLSIEDRKLIEEVLNEQETAWNEANVHEFMEGYWKSDSLAFVGSSGPVFGWEATRDRYLKNYPDAAAMGNLRFEIIRMQQVGEGVAQVLGKFILTRDSGEILSGYFTLIWRKFENGWLIVSDHTSSE